MPLTRTSGATISSTDEALVLARQIIDKDQATIARSSAGAEISCQSGCTACCHQAVPVGPAELRGILHAVAELPSEQRSRIEHRITETAARLRDAGFDADDLNRRTADERHSHLRRLLRPAHPVPAPRRRNLRDARRPTAGMS